MCRLKSQMPNFPQREVQRTQLLEQSGEQAQERWKALTKRRVLKTCRHTGCDPQPHATYQQQKDPTVHFKDVTVSSE